MTASRWFFLFAFFTLVVRFWTFSFPCALPNGAALSGFGIIDDFPDRLLNSVRYTIKLYPNGEKVLVSQPLFPSLEYGEEVKISGYVQRIEKSADLCANIQSPRMISLRRNKGNVLKKTLFNWRALVGEKIEEIFIEPESSLAKGLMLGDKGGFSFEMAEAFRGSGLAHLVALSGYNVSLVILCMAMLLQRFGRRVQFIFSAIAIFLFTVLTGASASVVRAGIMGFFWLAGKNLGRPNGGIRALLFACFLMILWNPRLLLYDIGFQLSAVATFALLLAGEWISPQSKWRIFTATLIIQLFTAPLLLFHFGKISLWAPITNTLVIPFVPIAMLLIFLSLIVSVFSFSLASIVGFFGSLFLEWIMRVAIFFG